MSEQQVVTFTVEEINQILTSLGEIPSKYSFPLILAIRQKAESQLKSDVAGDVSTDGDPVE